MNLHIPLDLSGARTRDLRLIPTKKFFKPVLVVEAPVSREEAGLIGCSYLWDQSGNPVEFEGAHHLKGELSGAEVLLAGNVDRVTLKTEKVAHFSLWREEKRGMKLAVRAHLPEIVPEQLTELLAFLAALNKDSYKATIYDKQGSLIGALANLVVPEGKEDTGYRFALPDAEGLYPVKSATCHPFVTKGAKAWIYTLDVPGGFIHGWRLELAFGKGLREDGHQLATSNPIVDSVSHARELAAGELLACITGNRVVPSTAPERQALGKMTDWIIDLAPILNKPSEEGGD